MAKKGKLSTSKAQKAQYAAYKAGSKVSKNKIAKLERHCKRFPKDEFNAENLERLKNKGFKYTRAKPRNPGINKDTQKVEAHSYTTGTLFEKETPGEQLSRLLGIPLRRTQYRKPGKAPITYKKRKNVKS